MVVTQNVLKPPKTAYQDADWFKYILSCVAATAAEGGKYILITHLESFLLIFIDFQLHILWIWPKLDYKYKEKSIRM